MSEAPAPELAQSPVEEPKGKALTLVRPEAAPADHAPKGPKETKGPKVPGKLGQINACLFDNHKQTRRMAWLFWLSWMACLALIGSFGIESWKLSKQRGEEIRVQKEAEVFARNQLLARTRQNNFNLGVFTIEIRPQNFPGTAETLNIAQIEVVAECDTPHTCQMIEHGVEPLRSLLNNIFLPLSREEILSKKGKLKLKQTVAKTINQWLPSGTVRNIYFSSLMLM